MYYGVVDVRQMEPRGELAFYRSPSNMPIPWSYLDFAELNAVMGCIAAPTCPACLKFSAVPSIQAMQSYNAKI